MAVLRVNRSSHLASLRSLIGVFSWPWPASRASEHQESQECHVFQVWLRSTGGHSVSLCFIAPATGRRNGHATSVREAGRPRKGRRCRTAPCDTLLARERQHERKERPRLRVAEERNSCIPCQKPPPSLATVGEYYPACYRRGLTRSVQYNRRRHQSTTRSRGTYLFWLLGVVPRDVVYSRDAGVVPPMPPCGRR